MFLSVESVGWNSWKYMKNKHKFKFKILFKQFGSTERETDRTYRKVKSKLYALTISCRFQINNRTEQALKHTQLKSHLINDKSIHL